MQARDFDRFMKLLADFDQVMLVTDRDGQLRSRPMAIGDVTDDGRIRFITRDDSAKLDELTERPRVNVSAQGDMRFLSISGNARLSKNRDLIDAAWQAKQSPWFAEGRDDPHVVVLEVIPTYAEYWDRSGTDLVTRVLSEARSALGTGERLDDEAGADHGDVDFRDKPL